jgi:hypothetical protein
VSLNSISVLRKERKRERGEATIPLAALTKREPSCVVHKDYSYPPTFLLMIRTENRDY